MLLKFLSPLNMRVRKGRETIEKKLQIWIENVILEQVPGNGQPMKQNRFVLT